MRVWFILSFSNFLERQGCVLPKISWFDPLFLCFILLINQLKTKEMKRLYIFVFLALIGVLGRTYGQEFRAVDDTYCINKGDRLYEIVVENDFLPQDYFAFPDQKNWDDCFTLSPKGELQFKNPEEPCCGTYELTYKVRIFGGELELSATINITIKCPKPNCSVIDLNGEDEGFPPNVSPQRKVFYACEDNPVTYFVDFVPGYTYTWIPGPGGSTSPGSNPAEVIITWANPGSNTLTLITNTGVNTITETFMIEVLPAPVASFTKSSSVVCLGSPITLNNTSTGSTSYYWDFGDGDTNQPMTNPFTHTYSSPGTYTITLYAYSANFDPKGNPLCCCVDSMQMSVVVESKPGPNIYWISTLCEGDKSFYWTDPANCQMTWIVQNAQGNNIPFTGQGNDTICVTWPSGPFGTISLQLSNCVPATLCEQPVTVSVPIISSEEIIQGNTVVCRNSKEIYTLPKWLGVDYTWTVTGGMIVTGQGMHEVVIMWGNGTTGTIHVEYGSPFLAGLPSHSGDDCTGVADLTVNIRPEFDLNPSPSVVCVGSTTVFSTNTSPPLGFSWTISPSLSGFPVAAANSVSATWTATGSYTICVTPNDPTLFCNSTVCRSITVVGTPPVDSISGPKSVCPNQPYTYFANSSQTNVSFMWTVTGGTASSLMGNPITVTWSNAASSYSISVKQVSLSSPFCSSTTINCPITKKVLAGPLTMSTSPLCTNKLGTYTCGPVQDPDAVYTWSVSPAVRGSVVSGQGSATATIQWNNSAGSVTITCIVELCGITNSITRTLTLNNPIIPTITQTGSLCQGGTSTLSIPATFTPVSWSTGSMTNSTTITASGNYVVTATDANLCTSVTSYVANYVPGPTASISSPDVLTYCVLPSIATTSVDLYAYTNPNYTFMWYCNGILQANTTALFTHISTSTPGTFVYKVKVTDISTGCFEWSNELKVFQLDCTGSTPPCVAQPHTVSISASTLTPLCNIANFFVTSSANVTLNGWDFNDPLNNINSGTLQNAQHTYAIAGCYPVELFYSVPNANPLFGPCGFVEYSSICIPLAAKFDVDLVTCRTYDFVDFSTFLIGNTITNWAWDFGDFTTSSLQNPTHSYATGGTYTVTLTVTSASGCQAQYTQTINAPFDPSASFTIAPTPPCVGDGIKYTPPVDPTIVSYLWDFGDGSSNAATCPQHSYLAAGTFNTSLLVTDNKGCTKTANLNIPVSPKFMPGPITFSPSLTVCFGNVVTLTAPAGAMYLWSNGQTTQTITVNTTGSYGVTVTNANNCKGSPSPVNVVILPEIIAQITGPTTICDDDCITLNASQGAGYTYQWFNELGIALPGQTSATFVNCTATFEDKVYVKITRNPNNCMATSSIWTMSLATSPTVVINTSTPTLCEGTPSVLTAVATPSTNILYSWSTGEVGPSIIVIQQGTYTVIATDTVTGCSATAFVIVNGLPDFCVMPTGCYEACNPDSLCGPPGLASYQWNFNGLPITGANSQCYEVTQSGSYSLTGTNDFGCSLTSDTLILVLIPCCDEDDTEVFVEGIDITDQGCCFKLSYSNNQDSLMSLEISTADADLFVANVAAPFNVIAASANSITIANITPGVPLPQGSISGFITICATSVQTSPAILNFTWNWPQYEALCQDSVLLDCPKSSDCVFIRRDNVKCNDDGTYTYVVEVCNSPTNTFAFTFLDLVEISPANIVVNPSTISLGSPIFPGQCDRFVFTLSGSNLAHKDFCFNLVVHENNPAEDSSALCCSLDSIHCIKLPGCVPCDDVYVEELIQNPEESCCYSIVVNNLDTDTQYEGILVCGLTPGTQLGLNNFIGSGWNTFNYTSTNFYLDYDNGFIPNGQSILPEICVADSDVAISDIELKWVTFWDGNNKYDVECKDTVQFLCPGDCGYYEIKKIICTREKYFIDVVFHNTSPFTVYSAYISFEDDFLSQFNQTVYFGPVEPGGVSDVVRICIGRDVPIGKPICFLTSLHNIEGNTSEFCCQFKTVVVIPRCPEDQRCNCDDAFKIEFEKGINCVVVGNKVTLRPSGNFYDCDQVVWDWEYNQTSNLTFGSESFMRVLPGPGVYRVWMTITRTQPDGTQCKLRTFKDIRILTSGQQLLLNPNPVREILNLNMRNENNVEEDKLVQILDVNGNVVYQINSRFDKDGRSSINVLNLQNGIYMVKVQDDTSTEQKKFIKIE